MISTKKAYENTPSLFYIFITTITKTATPIAILSCFNLTVVLGSSFSTTNCERNIYCSYIHLYQSQSNPIDRFLIYVYLSQKDGFVVLGLRLKGHSISYWCQHPTWFVCFTPQHWFFTS